MLKRIVKELLLSLLSLLSLLFLPTKICMAQQNYTATYSYSTMDLTPYASTTNLWKFLGGGGHCAPGSASPSYDGIFTCVGAGTDNYPYSFDPKTQTYTKHTEIGKVVMGASQNSGLYWMLMATSYCTAHGQPGSIFKYQNGTLTQPNTQACLSTLKVGSDGTLMGISGDTWKSTDGGLTWSDIGTGYSFVSLLNAGTACAIKAGQIYTYLPAGWTLLPTQPSGSQVGCAVLNTNPVTLMVWNSAHAVKLQKSNGSWGTVTGLAAYSIASSNGPSTFGLDSAGQPYHWNVFAPSVTGSLTGTWASGCPTPAFPCQNITPAPTHTGTFKVAYPHSINGVQTQQTIPWNQNMSLAPWDSNPNCDMFFGSPSDSECVAVSTGNVMCNASGHVLYSVPQPSGPLWMTENSVSRMESTNNAPLCGNSVTSDSYTCGYNTVPYCTNTTTPDLNPFVVNALEENDGWFDVSSVCLSINHGPYHCWGNPVTSSDHSYPNGQDPGTKECTVGSLDY